MGNLGNGYLKFKIFCGEFKKYQNKLLSFSLAKKRENVIHFLVFFMILDSKFYFILNNF